MGANVETLEDLLAPGLRAICIGINPAPSSVAAAHYYQGRLGQQFYRRIEQAGIVRFSGTDWQDDQAFRQGLGFTDLVKRPTRSADEVAEEELEFGRPLLLQKITTYRPHLLIFSFKKSAQKLVGPVDGNGLIQDVRVENLSLFVMPGPYAKREDVARALGELNDWWGSQEASKQ